MAEFKTKKVTKDAVHDFFARLREDNPEPESDLEWTNAYTLLVAVMAALCIVFTLGIVFSRTARTTCAAVVAAGLVSSIDNPETESP